MSAEISQEDLVERLRDQARASSVTRTFPVQESIFWIAADLIEGRRVDPDQRSFRDEAVDRLFHRWFLLEAAESARYGASPEAFYALRKEASEMASAIGVDWEEA